jgi:hypothetical protein
MTRILLRFFGAAALGILAASCSDTSQFSDTDMAKLGSLLFHQITNIGGGESVPRARAAAIPYASLGVRLGSSDESMFVLASKTGNDLHWVGGKKLAITTRNGRIVQTAGFAHNLTGYERFASQSVIDRPANSTNYVYDFAERLRYGVAVKCTVRQIGAERIVILGVPHDTGHVEEDCEAPDLSWKFQNELWSDRAGMIWKSEQSVDPDMDSFRLEILRPAE